MTQRQLPPTIYYGVERCGDYDMPQTRIRLFRSLSNAKTWFESDSRIDHFKDNSQSYPFYRVVYQMPWHFRFTYRWKLDAWIEENRPSRKDWWSMDDVRGEIVKDCGKPVRVC